MTRIQRLIDEQFDRIAGGKADLSHPGDFDPDELRRGIEVEMEHTDDRATAEEIAMDHLQEDPLYYTKLAMIHTD